MKNLSGFHRKALALAVFIAFVLPFTLRGDNGPAHQGLQFRPIELGTTGGNINDSSKLFCCSGTLGALVEDPAGQYILSNNHVIARTNLGIIGEDIIQPGLIDQTPVCAADAGDAVADLANFVPIKFKSKRTIPTNTVDAAIAKVRAGGVASNGAILDIGVVNNAVLDPAPLNLAVKKSGRTSGLTMGAITAVNVTVDVTYGKRCGVGSQTARFVGQFIVEPGSFSAGGDSGSLIVEDAGTAPRAVGLLFAGSSTHTIANPIGPVLAAFNVTMVGSPTVAASGFFGKALALAKSLWRPRESQAASQGLPGHVDAAAIEAVTRVKERHENRLLSIPGVVGLGVGISDRVSGQPVIEIYVKQATDALRGSLPAALDGVQVKIVETGEIVAH